MILDGKKLNVGSSIWHIVHGAGTVQHVWDGAISVKLDGQNMIFNNRGQLDGSPVTSSKLIGLSKPMIIWPENGESLAGLQSLVLAAIDFKRGVGQ